MSNIVEARQRLNIVIGDLTNLGLADYVKELEEIKELMTRKSPKRIAQPSATLITPKIIKEVKQYYRRHKTASQLDIAKVFNINPGRVSEIVNGNRS